MRSRCRAGADKAPASTRIVSATSVHLICSPTTRVMSTCAPRTPARTGGRPILPAELLIQRVHGEAVVPRRLPVQADTLALAADLIALFRAAQGRTRGELEAELQVLEGDQTDYRLKRGLAHLLASDFSTFEVGSPLEPAALRQRIFAAVRDVCPQSPAESGDAHGGGGRAQP